jgi:hypothetical protein
MKTELQGVTAKFFREGCRQSYKKLTPNFSEKDKDRATRSY